MERQAKGGDLSRNMLPRKALGRWELFVPKVCDVWQRGSTSCPPLRRHRLEVSGLMRNVAGEFARAYNRRKERMNAFWGDNFHATLVEEGRYLWRCLC